MVHSSSVVVCLHCIGGQRTVFRRSVRQWFTVSVIGRNVTAVNVAKLWVRELPTDFVAGQVLFLFIFIMYLFICIFIYSFFPSFIRSFVHSFVRSFIHSFPSTCPGRPCGQRDSHFAGCLELFRQGLKRPGREADQSPPDTVGVPSVSWSFTQGQLYSLQNSTPTLCTQFCWLMLRRVSALIVVRLQGAFFSLCSVCRNLYGRNSTCD